MWRSIGSCHRHVTHLYLLLLQLFLPQLAVDALFSVHGTEFTPENEAELYVASGTAMDWFCRELGATYCFTTELRDTGPDRSHPTSLPSL